MTLPSPKHFLDLSELDRACLAGMLDTARRLKQARAGRPHGEADAGAPLAGRLLALVFEKPSTRTRVSFDVAMRQLGGETIMLSGAEMQLGRGETIADTARVLSRYVDAAMLRILDHDHLLEFARHASIPVINGLTGRSHPCQIMADLLTLQEHKGDLSAL